MCIPKVFKASNLTIVDMHAMTLPRFGKSKQEAEDFVGSFEDAAVTRRLRIMGDDVRLFRCFPGDWQVRASSGSAYSYAGIS